MKKKREKQLPAYYVWASMKRRCLNPNNKSYKNYGGRGIKVCERWMEYKNFLEDMGEPPRGYSLDRIDNNKGYSPDNCRWADIYTQRNNTRVNRMVTYKGKTLTTAQWAKIYSIPRKTIAYRLGRGWDLDKVFNTPVRPTGRDMLQ